MWKLLARFWLISWFYKSNEINTLTLRPITDVIAQDLCSDCALTSIFTLNTLLVCRGSTTAPVWETSQRLLRGESISLAQHSRSDVKVTYHQNPITSRFNLFARTHTHRSTDIRRTDADNNEQYQVIIIIITMINVGAVGVSVGCWKAALTPDFITSSQNPTLRVWCTSLALEETSSLDRCPINDILHCEIRNVEIN